MKWNEFDTNIREYLRILREDQRLFDVTLVTDDGQHIQAHKIILSAGSNFFSDIFLKSNQTNMVIYLKGIVFNWNVFWTLCTMGKHLLGRKNLKSL